MIGCWTAIVQIVIFNFQLSEHSELIKNPIAVHDKQMLTNFALLLSQLELKLLHHQHNRRQYASKIHLLIVLGQLEEHQQLINLLWCPATTLQIPKCLQKEKKQVEMKYLQTYQIQIGVLHRHRRQLPQFPYRQIMSQVTTKKKMMILYHQHQQRQQSNTN